MARPDLATIYSETPDGIPYQVLIDPYKSRGARDANMDVNDVIVKWEDAEAFCREIVGFTEWNGSSTILSRHKPLESYLRPGLYCDNWELVSHGAYPERTETHDEFLDGWPVQDWARYRLTFLRPKYKIFSDETLVTYYSSKEQNRYCTLSRAYQPRERKTPSHGFETAADATVTPPHAGGQVISEVGFIPDYQLEYVVTWCQVPEDAVPEEAISLTVAKVNADPWKVPGTPYTFAAGTLLFKGPAQAFEKYQGADGGWYEDLAYVITFQPNGWNKYRLNNGNYVPFVARGTTTPPYGSADFDDLFVPGG